MSGKNDDPPPYSGPPQPPQAAYHHGGPYQGYNQDYAQQQGPSSAHGGYYQPNPQMGYYQQPPPQGYGPGPYGHPQGYPPQGYYDDRRSGPGFLEAMLASLACCCCLDCLLF